MARKARGLTQAELARLAKVHQPKISEIEQGKPNAQLGLVLRVIAALDLSIVLGNEQQTAPTVTATKPAIIVDEPLPDASIDIDAIVDKLRR
jgi:HTH-type transcriptional regulator/antitoxin HipB